MKHYLLLIILVLTVIFLTSNVLADVIVFENYDTVMQYKDGKLKVSKNLRLKNVGANPIIPGEIHFKISQEDKKGLIAPKVTDFKVVNKFEKELETRQVSTENEVDLVFTVWDPLLPEFFYDMEMTYVIDFKPNGLLFHQVILPEEKTTIPVKKSSMIFKIPKKYHVTYAPNAKVEKEEDNRVISWLEKNNYITEYSVLPLPKTGIKAVNVFWILVIVIVLVHLVFRLMRKARRSV